MKVVTKAEILSALSALGLKKGDHVMVHTSLGKIGYVIGGAQTVIEALTETVGAEGTIMMPTQSWKNLDPLEGVHPEADESDWDIIRAEWPAYDKRVTPTRTMGAVAEMFRSWPGAIRSDHPARSVTAWGRYADHLTKDHDLSDIFGETSPLARLYALDGKVLLLGVGYDKNTSIHLADARAEYPSKHDCDQYSAVMENGARVWKKYSTLYVDGEDFIPMGEAFEKEREVTVGQVGGARARLMRQRDIVDFAVKWITENRK